MKIVVTHQKGGTAKSTTALALAVALIEAGNEIELVELDPQMSLTAWANAIGIASTPGARYTIIDTPPSVFDKKTIEALSTADRVIIPSGTSVSDLQVTASTLPLIKEQTKGSMKILWSRIQANTQAAKSIAEITDKIGYSAYKSTIGLRQCYQQDFLLKGWSGLNPQAKDEVSRFVLEAIS